jgi:hypothetical protein
MLFKNAALLYGLFFLLVPIIVHLFQLRRFRKVAFTNVAFLKPLITQTRKSRVLKKWLTLLTRLLAVACIVIAFAQPYFEENATDLDQSLMIYLDNSYSMQARGADGILYQTAVKNLVEKLPVDQNFTLFTNDKVFSNTNRREIANELVSSKPAARQLSFNEVLLKSKSLQQSSDQDYKLVWISDFQKTQTVDPTSISTDQIDFIKLTPVEFVNVSVDTAYAINDATAGKILEVNISSSKSMEAPVSVSFINNGSLFAKTSVDLSSQKGKITFTIPANLSLNGTVQVEDDGYAFDNQLYVASSSRPKIKVLHVNNTDIDFLSRIYTDDEFEYMQVTPRSLNFNAIKDQEVVIINELQEISNALARELNAFVNAGGSVILIPSTTGTGYEQIVGVTTSNVAQVEKRITGINFDHPVLRDVFSKRVTNFQYPKVGSTVYSLNASNEILEYEDGSSFLYQNGNVFVFTAPLNSSYSNFFNSPLVVPVFYKMGLNFAGTVQVYQQIGANSKVKIPVQLGNDEILQLSRESINIIPEQRAYDAFVQLNTGKEINYPGIYEILKNDVVIDHIAYNLDRTENDGSYMTNNEIPGEVKTSIASFLQNWNERGAGQDLWKYFALAAFLFLLFEILILKFLK